MILLYLDPIKSDKPLVENHDIVTASADEFKSAFRSDYVITGKVRKLKPLLESMDPKPDVILHGYRAGNNLYSDIHEVEIPRIYFAADTVLVDKWVGKYASAFDAVITTQRDYLDYFKTFGVEHVYWSPWFSNATYDMCEKSPPENAREYDVGYVGNFNLYFHGTKREFFLKLKERFDGLRLRYFIGNGDWWEVYSNSKIVINFCLGEVNIRTFEALSAGALLLTPFSGNGLTELFSDDEIVTYNDSDCDDAISKITYYLGNNDERVRIARNGWDKVKGNHLYINHVDRLFKIIDEVRNRVKTAKRTSETIRYNIADALVHLASRPLPEGTTEAQKREMVDKRINSAMELLLMNKEDERSKVLYAECTKILERKFEDIETKPYVVDVPDFTM